MQWVRMVRACFHGTYPVISPVTDRLTGSGLVWWTGWGKTASVHTLTARTQNDGQHVYPVHNVAVKLTVSVYHTLWLDLGIMA